MIIVYVLIFIALFLMWGALMNHSDSKKKRKEIERKVKDEKIRIDSLTPREKEAELKINLERGKDRCFRQRVLKLKEIIESTEEGRHIRSRLSQYEMDVFMKSMEVSYPDICSKGLDDEYFKNFSLKILMSFILPSRTSLLFSITSLNSLFIRLFIPSLMFFLIFSSCL